MESTDKSREPSSTASRSTRNTASESSSTTAAAVHAAKEFAEMIVNTVREGLLVLDTGLRVQSANKSFYDAFQVSPEETEGRLVYELGSGQWDIPELRRLLEEILPENKIFNDFEVEHDFEDIGHRVMLLNARRLNHQQLILLAIEDVTERHRGKQALRESEERFRLLLENAKEYAIFTMDAETRITLWSPSAERILGWREEEVRGKQGNLIFTPEDLATDKPEQEIKRACDAGSSLDDRWHMRKDGSCFWATGIMVALKEKDKLRGFVKILRDNTARKQAEEERETLLAALAHERARLKEINETLEERVEERTKQVRALASTLTMAEQEERRRIAQILHDDLQQRLYGIQMKMTFLRQDIAAEDLESLRNNAEQSDKWLRTAIEITRQLTVDLSPPVLQKEGLRDALVWLLTQMQKLHGLQVNLQADHAFYMEDEDMRVLLFQIVRELLFNIVKHADTDCATVALHQQDHHLVIHVIDEGKGFSLEEAENRAQHVGGFGLFSVRERLNLFGGRMDIHSAPGQGTRVMIRVPSLLEE